MEIETIDQMKEAEEEEAEEEEAEEEEAKEEAVGEGEDYASAYPDLGAPYSKLFQCPGCEEQAAEVFSSPFG